MIKKIIAKNKYYWTKKQFVFSALLSVGLFIIALIINYFAGVYAQGNISNSVNDILLDKLPILDVSFIVLQASALFILGILLCLVIQPQKLPFALESISLFIVIRSIFINLTHLAPPLGIEYQQSFLDPNSILHKFTFGGDLFFSGHTGLPFLMALIYWNNKYLRSLFLISSAISGGAVLFGHLHYSIDVFGAFFITYSIFMISKKIFGKSFVLFVNGLAENALPKIK